MPLVINTSRLGRTGLSENGFRTELKTITNEQSFFAKDHRSCNQYRLKSVFFVVVEIEN